MATLALFVALELRTAALSSLYLQNVLGSGALEAGLGFLPFAVVIGGGVHVAGHLIARAGVRVPMASGFAMAAGGLLLLSRVSAGGSYFADVLPGMLIVGAGLGMILVPVSVSVLTSAAEEESGMLSGLNTTMARLEPLLERTAGRHVPAGRLRGVACLDAARARPRGERRAAHGADQRRRRRTRAPHHGPRRGQRPLGFLARRREHGWSPVGIDSRRTHDEP